MISPIPPDEPDDDEQPESDEIDPTRVDIDPMLFGEIDHGPIEEMGDMIGVDDPELYREWQREVTLLRLTGACPKCDGPTNYLEMDNGEEDVESWTCMDCWSEWFASE